MENSVRARNVAKISFHKTRMDVLQAQRKSLKNGLKNTARSRSPIAEGVFAKTVSDMGFSEKWEIDSAALGSWHVGNDPDHRALDTMRNHGVPYSNQARQITKKDFDYYDYIFGMDEENMRELKRKAPAGSKAKLLLLGEFDPQGDRIIRDPYYDNGSEGFEKCYQQSVRCSKAFLEKQ